MRLSYLDTSAAFKLVADEPESGALVAELGQDDRPQLVSSWLLHTELYCAAGRSPAPIPAEHLQAVLTNVMLVDLRRGDLISAAGQRGLQSNDAIHLSVAERLGVDELITYDAELAAAATQAGLSVVSPA